MRTARAKGISEQRVLSRHVVRSSLGVFVSLFALDFGALVGGGALLIEVVFGLPGVGRLTYQSLGGLDLPVIMATVLYGGFFIVITNAFVDIALRPPRPAYRGGHGMTEPLLEVRDLLVTFRTDGRRRHRGRRRLARARRDEVLGIVGESGSGKSVTMMSVMRLDPDPQHARSRARCTYGGRTCCSSRSASDARASAAARSR